MSSKTYTAFISYSHAADGKLAPALQDALHQFAKPWYKLRSIRTFRDTSNLSANPDLWSSIRVALAQSEYLLLVASPDAAASAWVPREVKAFLEDGSAKNIILILSEGELAWDDLTADFDWRATTAFPRLGRKVFDSEPLWVDLRWARSEEHLDQHNPRFREAVAKISSALRDMPLDMLIGEDVRQHKRAMRLLWGGAATLAALSVVLALTSVVAVSQRRRAETQTGIAIRQRDLAVSRQLAAQSRESIEDRTDLALLLADEALSTSDTSQARSALLSALSYEPRMVRYLHRHTAAVTSLAFCGAKVLASAGRDGDASIRYWDVQKGKLLRKPVKAENFRVDAVACSPDGKVLATTGDGGLIHLWDSVTGAPLSVIKPNQSFIASLLFRDNTILAAGGGYGELRLWNVRTGQPASVAVQAHTGMASLGGGASESNAINALAFSGDSKVVVTGAMDGLIARWDGATLKPAGETVLAHKGGIESLVFSPDGRVLASGGYLGEIRLWTWPGMQPLGKPVQAYSSEVKLAFTPSGLLLSTDYSGIVRQWKGTTLEPAGPEIRARQGRVWNIAAGPEDLIATAGDDGTVILWNVNKADRLCTTFSAHAENGAAIAGDGTLITAGNDVHIRFWSLPEHSLVKDIELPELGKVESLACCPAGQIAVGGQNGDMGFFDAATRKLVRPVLKALKREVDVVTFSTSGDKVASGDFIPGEIRMFDGRNGEALTPATDAGLGYLWALAFGPDGNVLASSGESGMIRLWSAEDLKPLSPPIRLHAMGMNFLAFRPDGRLVSAGGRASDLDNAIYLLDGRTGRQLGPPIPAPPLSAVCFTADGTMLAGGGFDGKLHLWAGQTLEFIGILAGGPQEVVRHLSCSKDGRVVAAYDDGRIAIWNLDLKFWHWQARTIANRELTPKERERFLPEAIAEPEKPLRNQTGWSSLNR